MVNKKALFVLLLLVVLAGCTDAVDQTEANTNIESDVTIKEISTPESLSFDEVATVSATVENSGDTNYNVDVRIQLNGTVLDDKTVRIAAGNSTTIKSQIDTSNFEPGTYDLVVDASGASEIETVAIQERQPATFEVDHISMPDTINYNDSLNVEVDIMNAGDFEAEQKVTIALSDAYTSEVEVDIGPRQLETISVSFDTVQKPGGKYQVTASTVNQSRSSELQLDHPSPYDKTEIKLYVNDSMVERDVSEMIEDSTKYWEEHDIEYLGYPVEYTIVDDREQADKVLEFTDVTSCGLVEQPKNHPYGCADVVGDSVFYTVSAYVQYNLTNPTMSHTIKHELGHTLGLEHGDEPDFIMQEYVPTLSTVKPANIYLRSTSGNVPRSVERETIRALEYFEEHEDLIETNEFEWQFVESTQDAHIIITHDSSGNSCGFDTGYIGSCTKEGQYDDQYDIRLDDTGSSFTAYFVGVQIGQRLLTSLPEDLSTDTTSSEKENWPR